MPDKIEDREGPKADVVADLSAAACPVTKTAGLVFTRTLVIQRSEELAGSIRLAASAPAIGLLVNAHWRR
jgi:hypothetical protein